MNDADLRQVQDEAKANPAFGRKLDSMLRQPGGEREVSISARKSIANQFNPSLYPESKGEWGVLRRRATALAESMPGIVQNIVDRMPLSEKMASVRTIAQGGEPRMVVAGIGELGQFEIIGSLIGAAAGAASNIYSASVTASAQKQIAQLQADTAMKSVQAQMAISNAAAAIQQAQAVQAAQQGPVAQAASFLTQNIGGGIPVWAVPAAVGVAGVAIFFSTRRKRR